ncbi:MAG: EamA family transporter [Lautropia sp.]
MERWVVYAFCSMFFAGATAVLAKAGLAGISSELGLVVRTLMVAAFVVLFGLWAVDPAEAKALTSLNLLWLGLSALATAASWVFYYKALKDGDVATVALIDKGSVVVAIVLAWLLLGEPLSSRTVAGTALIVAGLLVLLRR